MPGKKQKGSQLNSEMEALSFLFSLGFFVSCLEMQCANCLSGNNEAQMLSLLTCDTEICSTANLSKYWGPFHLTCLFACESVCFFKHCEVATIVAWCFYAF